MRETEQSSQEGEHDMTLPLDRIRALNKWIQCTQCNRSDAQIATSLKDGEVVVKCPDCGNFDLLVEGNTDKMGKGGGTDTMLMTSSGRKLQRAASGEWEDVGCLVCGETIEEQDDGVLVHSDCKDHDD